MNGIKLTGKFTPVAGGALLGIFYYRSLFLLIPADNVYKTGPVAFSAAGAFFFVNNYLMHRYWLPPNILA
jgi:hypothetical protein